MRLSLVRMILVCYHRRRRTVNRREGCSVCRKPLRSPKKLADAIFSAGESTVCLLACGSPGGKRCKESLAAQGSPRVYRQSRLPLEGKLSAKQTDEVKKLLQPVACPAHSPHPSSLRDATFSSRRRHLRSATPPFLSEPEPKKTKKPTKPLPPRGPGAAAPGWGGGKRFLRA